MSDVTAYTPLVYGPFGREPDIFDLWEKLEEHNVTHFRTVSGKILKTVGRLNRKSVPYSSHIAATWPYHRIESFGQGSLTKLDYVRLGTLRGNQWTR